MCVNGLSNKEKVMEVEVYITKIGFLPGDVRSSSNFLFFVDGCYNKMIQYTTMKNIVPCSSIHF